MNVNGYAVGTERVYARWIIRFIGYNKMQHPNTLNPNNAIEQFLTYLAVQKHLAPASINQARDALIYLYKNVLQKPIEGITRARHQRANIAQLIDHQTAVLVIQTLPGKYSLMALLIYGAGLQPGECAKLKLSDIDMTAQTILNRTMIPQCAIEPLTAQMALAQHWPGNRAGYLFPSSRIDHKTGQCWHVSPASLEKAMKQATQKMGLLQPVTPRVLRYTFAAELLRAGYNVRTVQELMGYKSLRRIMQIQSMIMLRNVQSPIDVNMRKNY